MAIGVKRGLEENSDFDSSDDEYEPIKQETESEWWIQLYTKSYYKRKYLFYTRTTNEKTLTLFPI